MAEENIKNLDEEIVENRGENDTVQPTDDFAPEVEEVAKILENTEDNNADTDSEGTATTPSASEDTNDEFTLPEDAVWPDEVASYPNSEVQEFILPTIEEQILIPDFAPLPVDQSATSENNRETPLFPTADLDDLSADEEKTPDEEQILIDIASAVSDEEKSEDIDEDAESDKTQGKTDEQKKDEAPSRFVDTVFDFVELAVFTLTLIMILTSFFFRHSIVDGDSMLGTLEDGQHLIISNFMYEPKVGDIVVVEDYSTALKKPIIKRIIATEGQKVRVTKEGIYVDGKFLKEEYVHISQEGYYYDVTPSVVYIENEALKETLTIMPGLYYEFVVPEGEIFVMGDHRNNSTDSRHIGTVDKDALIGRVVLRFFPFDKFGTVYN